MPDRPVPSSAEGRLLTIGGLAERTGVAPATLRMWEQRHGFPVPVRLPSGHRRYTDDDVRSVSEVLRRREKGARLEAAIGQVVADRHEQDGPGPLSVYAELQRRHPHLVGHQLRKSTLIALSHAIEDEYCARAVHAHLFGSFQRARFWRPARDRWTEMARTASSTTVFHGMSEGPAVHEPAPGSRGPVRVELPDDAPMLREWAVVCEARDLPIALTAWELPGQTSVPDRERLFESVWTVDPVAVRDAARVFARAAAEAGTAGGQDLVDQLADDAPDREPEAGRLAALFNRVVAYVDVSRAPAPGPA